MIGRSLIEELEKQQDWEINGITRRVSENKDKSNYLSLDLMNREACRRKLRREVGRATHPEQPLREWILVDMVTLRLRRMSGVTGSR